MGIVRDARGRFANRRAKFPLAYDDRVATEQEWKRIGEIPEGLREDKPIVWRPMAPVMVFTGAPASAPATAPPPPPDPKPPVVPHPYKTVSEVRNKYIKFGDAYVVSCCLGIPPKGEYGHNMMSCSGIGLYRFWANQKHIKEIPDEVWTEYMDMLASYLVVGIMSEEQTRDYEVWLKQFKKNGWQVTQFKGAHATYCTMVLSLKNKKEYK